MPLSSRHKRAFIKAAGLPVASLSLAFSAQAQTLELNPLGLRLCPPPPPIEVCLPTASNDLGTRLPDSQKFIEEISSAPLTGKPIVENMKNAAQKLNVCETTGMPNEFGAQAQFSIARRSLMMPMMARDKDMSDFAHEAFHAWQDRSGAGNLWSGVPELKKQDHVFAVFLSEAAAVAYAHMVMHEIGETDLSAYTNFMTSWHARGVAPLFNQAYDASWALNAALPDEARKKAALSAGGVAVVRHFLMAGEQSWTDLYRIQASAMTTGRDAPATANDDAYPAARDAIFRMLGEISPGLSVVPPEVLGQNGSQSIGIYLQWQRYDINNPPPSVQRVRTPRPLLPCPVTTKIPGFDLPPISLKPVS